jgi:hypothetical protein
LPITLALQLLLFSSRTDEKVGDAIDPYCTCVLSRLSEHESQWKQFISATADEEALVADAVIVSAFLTYCGGLDVDLRYDVAKMSLEK